MKKEYMVYDAFFDAGRSYTREIRLVSGAKIEVDRCEVWFGKVHNRDYYKSRTIPADWSPQTMTIERLDAGWFVTEIEHYDSPHFC